MLELQEAPPGTRKVMLDEARACKKSPAAFRTAVGLISPAGDDSWVVPDEVASIEESCLFYNRCEGSGTRKQPAGVVRPLLEQGRKVWSASPLC